MKILFFIENLQSGGKERRLAELLKGLKRYKEFEEELVITKKEIHYQNINSLGIKIHVIERKHLKKDPRLFFLFYRICRQFKPDIIHVWGNMPAFYAIPAKVLMNLPVINNQITDAPIKPDGGIISHRINFLFAESIIANSFAGLKSYGVSGKKGKVIHNGFDFDRLSNLALQEEVREHLNIRTKYTVGMVATFYWAKDYKTYISAAKQLLEERNDITFLCIGAGDFSTYEKSVPEAMKNNIRFLPKQTNVESILNVCDVGVLATFTEGIPNTIMEFMALGKPVVVTDGGGTPELVVHEKTGFLVPVSNDVEIVNRLRQLLDNESLRIEMGKAGKERIMKYFSYDRMIESYCQAFREIIGEKKNYIRK